MGTSKETVKYKKVFLSSHLQAHLRHRLAAVFLVTAVSLWSQPASKNVHPAEAIPPAVRRALAQISAANLKGNLSFLASDALAGRYTPSPGLDVAAEFIASQFRAAGLQPGGDHGYFQVASMVDRKMPAVSSPLTVQIEDADKLTVPIESLSVTATSNKVTLEHCPVVLVKERDPQVLRNIDLSGKVVVAPSRAMQSIPAEQREAVYAKMQAFDKAINLSDARAVVLVGRPRRGGRSLLTGEQVKQSRVPVVVADCEDLQKWIDKPDSDAKMTISLEIPGPEDQKVDLKNVIAVLPGSDPQLKSTCVMLTAHYDHIGTFETGKNMSMTKEANPVDRIFNGANDDGSGTVSVIEIARALASLNPRPRRSIVFMTFFGEERGDIGSGYYGQHPVFPVSKTVADINLEQVGRTDSTVGKQVNTASVTGYDYSEVTKYMEKAGRLTGIRVYLDKTASDDYFVRSDNAALAEQGVPAHTLCVAFDYPDYHGLGDEWQKVDYDNMARVDRMVALALIDIANNPIAPRWNSRNPKTALFREAQSKQSP